MMKTEAEGDLMENDMRQTGVCDENTGDQFLWKLMTRVENPKYQEEKAKEMKTTVLFPKKLINKIYTNFTQTKIAFKINITNETLHTIKSYTYKLCHTQNVFH